jgi:haloacetate dehalogenase
MENFEAIEVQTEETSIFLRRFGSGPPVLLLHGFPQTHLMWRSVAPLLALRFTVICADLRGYGRSGCPPSRADHAPYAKRAMAKDMISVMGKLGFPCFSVAGHDRGGRVAYRLALDHPGGSDAAAFSSEVRAAYIDALRDLAHVHAICEEYRAAATLDYEHDLTDRGAGRRITCPLLVLWSAHGPLSSWYAEAGGPLALWRAWANDVYGGPLEGGHFFPEEIPERTAKELGDFFAPAIRKT